MWKPFNTSSQRWIQHFLCLAVITLRSGWGGEAVLDPSKNNRFPSSSESRQTWAAEFATSLFRPLISIPTRFSAGRPATTIFIYGANVIHSNSDAVLIKSKSLNFFLHFEAVLFVHVKEIFISSFYLCLWCSHWIILTQCDNPWRKNLNYFCLPFHSEAVHSPAAIIWASLG